MKYLIAIGAIAALLSVATMPASAFPFCSSSSSHASNTVVPPVCSLPESKEKHPGWFRDGGYCDGAASATEATANTQYHCLKLPFPFP